MARGKAKTKRGDKELGGVSIAELDRLAGGTPIAGHRRLSMRAMAAWTCCAACRCGSRAASSLCLVGPNGAGKSTVLNAIYGFARIFSGTVTLSGRDIATLPPSEKLKDRAACLCAAEEFGLPRHDGRGESAGWAAICSSCPSEAQGRGRALCSTAIRAESARAGERARVLSGGERRLLEISRALIMDPEVAADRRAVDRARAARHRHDLRDAARTARRGGKTLILVEQNARKGLEFADVGYVLVAGRWSERAAEGTARRSRYRPAVSGRLDYSASPA